MMSTKKYFAIITDVGQSKIAEAVAGGQKLNITTFLVGDGNGEYYVPTSDMTAIKNEVWRGTISKADVVQDAQKILRITTVIPAEVSGFIVREIALLDETGELIAIGNTPDLPKVRLEDGASTELKLTMRLAVKNTEALSFTIDPHTVIMTKDMLDTHNVDDNAHNELFEGKYDKTGGTISGNVVIQGNVAEGNGLTANISDSVSAHAEGEYTTTFGRYVHVEGGGCVASADGSHAEGSQTIAGGLVLKIKSVDAENKIIAFDDTITNFSTIFNTIVADTKLHIINAYYVNDATRVTVESIDTTNHSIVVKEEIPSSNFNPSYAVVLVSYNSVRCAHAEGYRTTASSSYSHAEGYGTVASGSNSHAEGYGTVASGYGAHAEGEDTTASGYGAHAEGEDTTASGFYAHAEGSSTTASGFYAHAEGSSTTANYNNSHAEGYGTIASNHFSHAEGRTTKANGQASHAEGEDTIASGSNSHAEGCQTTANGAYSHVEGRACYASGTGSHASGNTSIAASDGTALFVLSATGTTITIDSTGQYQHPSAVKTILEKFAVSQEILLLNNYYVNSYFIKKKIVSVDITNYKIVIDSAVPTSGFICKMLINPSAYSNSKYYSCYAEGATCISIGDTSHAEGYETVASGNYSHAEGYMTTASSSYSHAEGGDTTASGNYSHAEGGVTKALSNYSHAEGGNNTTASDMFAHAEGQYTTASGNSSHSEGLSTKASGGRAHAEGHETKASGEAAHAEGYYTTASGNYSHAGGYYTTANNLQTVIGKYNTSYTGGSETGTSGSAFIIGNGTSNSARSNCFRVQYNGVTYSKGSYNTSGADYAEYFEWLDGNTKKEDRTGLFVTLDGEKIRIATPDDDYILGIVSACPSIVGNAQDDQWGNMYEKDVFGREITEEIDVPDKVIEMPDPENSERTITQVICEAHKEIVPKLNIEYDNTQKYIPRSERPEWDTIGMLGKLVTVDDGSCEVNGWCKVGKGGVATKSEKRTQFRVISRLDKNHIRVLIL